MTENGKVVEKNLSVKGFKIYGVYLYWIDHHLSIQNNLDYYRIEYTY